jgi:hypothetical protein
MQFPAIASERVPEPQNRNVFAPKFQRLARFGHPASPKTIARMLSSSGTTFTGDILGSSQPDTPAARPKNRIGFQSPMKRPFNEIAVHLLTEH